MPHVMNTVLTCHGLDEQALRGLHNPTLRFSDAMQRICELLQKGNTDLALKTFAKMKGECLVTVGRKIHDKVDQEGG